MLSRRGLGIHTAAMFAKIQLLHIPHLPSKTYHSDELHVKCRMLSLAGR